MFPLPIPRACRAAVPTAFIAAASLSLSGQGPIPPFNSKAPKYGYTVVKSYPHDPKAYTQGLEYSGGTLYESTGLKGQSGMRKVDLESGKVLEEVKLHPQYFGEGITVAAGKLFQVTWQGPRGVRL